MILIPHGPGYREESLDLELGGPFTGRIQPINMGSCAQVDNTPNFNPQGSLALQALIRPTLVGRGSQTLLSQENPQTRTGFRFYIDADAHLSFEITANGDVQANVRTDTRLVTQRW